MPINIEEQLLTFIHYYNRTRRVGHTYAMIHGVTNEGSENAIVICANSSHAKHIKDEVINSVITCSELYKLHDVKRPIVFDNFTLMTIFNDAMDEIHRLKQRNKELQALEEHVLKEKEDA